LKDLSYNFGLLKPDGVKVVDEIVSDFKTSELKVEVGELVYATISQIERHFRINDIAYTKCMGKKFFDNCVSDDFPTTKFTELIGYSSESPVILHDDIYLAAGKVLFEINKKYFSSGPLIPLFITGIGDFVIFESREIIGSTNPAKAAEGTIRQKFSKCDLKIANFELEPCTNVIHVSENWQERNRELKIWWPEKSRE
jgi:nucleoside diphosphate kinase